MAGKDVSYKKVRRKRNKLLKLGLVLILVIGVALVGVYEFSRTHFGKSNYSRNRLLLAFSRRGKGENRKQHRKHRNLLYNKQ